MSTYGFHELGEVVAIFAQVTPTLRTTGPNKTGIAAGDRQLHNLRVVDLASAPKACKKSG